MKKIAKEFKFALGFFIISVSSIVSVFTFSILPIYGLVGKNIVTDTSYSEAADHVIRRSEMLNWVLIPIFLATFLATIVMTVLGLIRSTKKHGQ